MEPIHYFDRASQTIQREAIYGQRSIKMLYGKGIRAFVLSKMLLPFARSPFFSKLYGFLQKTKRSRKKILPFVQQFAVDASEFLHPIETFNSFNDFFIRHLRPECRPINAHPHHAILPADGRYLVFPKISRDTPFYVKGGRFNLESFLKDAALAREFDQGAIAIARLCPVDYHRFHFPIDGTLTPPREVPGPLYSVNPWALKKRLSIFWENRRVITAIDTLAFGKVLMVEVGATCVGTIHQTCRESQVKKGQEKGYFSFGGSCIVLLFQKDRILFAEDLVHNSGQGIETRGLFGTLLGVSISR